MKLLIPLILILLLALPTLAQKRTSSQLLELKARLEKDIQSNLENSISTQLEKGTFSVGPDVQLVEVPPSKAPPKPKVENDRPLGLDMGLINVEEIVTSYEKELEELRLKKEGQTKDNEKKNFEIEKISVEVGIASQYPEEYRKKFENWVKTKIRKDYGASAQAHVSVIEVVSENDLPKPSWKDQLKGFQQFLGLALLAFGVMLGLWLIGRAFVKAAREHRHATLQSQGAWNLALPEGQEKSGEGRETPALPEALPSSNDLETLITKIAFVCMELKGKVNELVRVWVDSGDDGFLKSALLVDALMTAREKILNQTGAVPMLQLPIDDDLVQSREENFAEAYRQVNQMDFADRIPHMEKIYWDLVSVRTLGIQSLRRPFDFLSSLEVNQVQELLTQQKEESRALALMYMNEDSRAQLFDRTEEDAKERMILEVLQHSQISQNSIWDSDMALKMVAMNNTQPNREKLVNLFPRTMEVLSVLSTLQEINILRKISPSLPYEGRDLKSQYVCLSFIDEWKPEYVRRLMGVASAEEVTGLITVLPAIRESVLDQVSPKVRIIVEDDLKIVGQRDSSGLSKKLDSLKMKWMRIVQAEKIPLEKVLRAKEMTDGATDAAKVA